MEQKWHAMAVEEIFELLKSSADGLSSKAAAKHLLQYSKNELPKPPRNSAWEILWQQIKSPLIFLLLIAAGAEAAVRSFDNAILITLAVLANILVGFYQEYKAQSTILALREYLSYNGKVLRDGKKQLVPSAEIVPGDVVYLEAGDRVPADGRLLFIQDLQTNEASLTGESTPVKKQLGEFEDGTLVSDRLNMCFAGTIVAKGVGILIITQTGAQTEFGKISGMVLQTEEEMTPLQHRIERFARYVGIFVLAVAILVFLVGLYRGYSLLQMFETSVSLAVAAIPEGMLISITVIMVLGMQRILKQNALVRRLAATETIGSVTVICTDKTGTLTLGEMRVVEIFHGAGLKAQISETKSLTAADGSLEALLIAAILCNDAEVKMGADHESGLVVGDPTEVALVRCAQDFKLDEFELRKIHPRIGVVPFDEKNKYMVTMHDGSGKEHFLAVKGAPELIIDHCVSYLDNGNEVNLNHQVLERFNNSYHEMTSRGLRVLAIARKAVLGGELTVDSLPEKMTLLGVVGISDPLRSDARKMIELARSAGIRPVIITGDHALTARSIGQQLGYDVQVHPVIEGVMIDHWSEAEFKKNIGSVEIFARVTPAHKIKIVQAFESLGEVVAMVGDGVNDAPALKAADVGIALGSGTDVAKEVSDVVLIDNSFKTIVYAIRQGRIIFDNIRKVLIYLLSDATAETMLVLFSLIVGAPVPLTVMQILMINIIVDGLPNVALTFEKGEQGVMERKPRPRNEDIITKTLLKVIFTVGAVMDVALIGVFVWMMRAGEPIDHIRTILFLSLSIGSLLYAYSCKDLYHAVWKTKIFDNRFLNYVVAGSFLILLLVVYVPALGSFFDLEAPSLAEWGIIGLVGFIKPLTMEIVKKVLLRKKIDSVF